MFSDELYNCSESRDFFNHYSLLADSEPNITNLTNLIEACNCTTWYRDTRDAVPISAIRIVTSVLSILGSTSIILSALLTGRLNTSEVHPLFLLSVGDFILSILWLIGGIVWLTPGKGGWARAESESHSGMCYVLGVATTMAGIVTFLLTVVYSISALISIFELYRNKGRSIAKTRRQKTIKSITQIILYAISWALPLIVVLAATESLVGIATTNQGCWCIVDFFNLRPDNGDVHGGSPFNVFATVQASLIAVFYIVSAFLIIMIYIVIFYLARKIVQFQGMDDGKGGKVMKSTVIRLSLFVVIFLVCGAPSFAAAISVWSEKERLHLYEIGDKVILYFHAILGPLQGGLNAIVYGWSRREFRKAVNLRQRVPGVGTTRTGNGARYDSIRRPPQPEGDQGSGSGLILNAEDT